jgi:hypothetical protein
LGSTASAKVALHDSADCCFNVFSSPALFTSNTTDSDDTWTVTVGGGFGMIFRIGLQPVNDQIQAFYNVETPDSIADWQMYFSERPNSTI